jgi:hypothetical protein
VAKWLERYCRERMREKSWIVLDQPFFVSSSKIYILKDIERLSYSCQAKINKQGIKEHRYDK